MTEREIDVKRELLVITGKLQGLGELFSMSRGEPPLSDTGCIGVADLLIGLANELDSLIDVIKPQMFDTQ